MCETGAILFTLVYIALAIGISLAQHNPNFKANRTGIVQLFEWKFSDIAHECEQFLGPFGYGGVQVICCARKRFRVYS